MTLKTTILVFVLISVVAACNGKPVYRDTTEAFTQYHEIELVDFSISGTATCSSCDTSKITALQIEIVPENDPIHTIAMNVFDGLGSFWFSDLRHKKGAKLTIYGKIYFGTGETYKEESTEIEVPQDDDQIVTCVINFGR